jgi:hypothetical protein
LATHLGEWRGSWDAARLGDPSEKALDVGRLTELQDGIVEAARRLRAAGLPSGHP